MDGSGTNYFVGLGHKMCLSVVLYCVKSYAGIDTVMLLRYLISRFLHRNVVVMVTVPVYGGAEV